MKLTNKSLLLIGLALTGPVRGNALDDLLASASGGTAAVPPTLSQLQQAKTLFAELLAGTAGKGWPDLQMQTSRQQDITFVQESPAARQGRGLFAVRANAVKNTLLQAPHADTDLYTGQIVSRLFSEGGFKAAQWNTVKRHTIDLAHIDASYWQQFALAFAERYRDGKIIQLHGFEQKLRKTKTGAHADMIVSAGVKAPPAWVYQTANCLKAVFPHRVSLYPQDIQELGGTTNAQGRMLQSVGHGGFLHIEMSKALRKQLRDDAALRQRFAACL